MNLSILSLVKKQYLQYLYQPTSGRLYEKIRLFIYLYF